MRPAADPVSPMHPTRLAETCGTCHSDPGLGDDAEVKLIQASCRLQRDRPRQGGRGREKRPPPAAPVTGATPFSPATTSARRRNRKNGPAALGERTRRSPRRRDRAGSARRRAHRRGHVCTDCHGEQRILAPREQSSRRSTSTNAAEDDLRALPRRRAADREVRLADRSRYRIRGQLSRSRAARGGKVTVANCASCHGVHDILPSERSALPRAQGQPVRRRAARVTPARGRSMRSARFTWSRPIEPVTHAVVYWVRFGYLWMIAARDRGDACSTTGSTCVGRRSRR